MDTEQPSTITASAEDSGGGDGPPKSSTLDDIFGEDDPSAISAIVGQLESSIESSLMNDHENSSNINDNKNNNSSHNGDTNDTNGQNSSAMLDSSIFLNSSNNNNTNNINNNINNNNNDSVHKNSNGTMFQEQQQTSSTATPSTNISNHQTPSPIITSQSSLSSTTTNTGPSLSSTLSQEATTTPMLATTNNHNNQSISSMDVSNNAGGKRILLSANSQPVNISISNINQQQQSSMVRISPLTNGTMTPPQSPSTLLVTAATMPTTNTASLTKPIAQKSNPAHLSIQSNGSQQPSPHQPILMTTTPGNLNLNLRPTNVQISNAPQVSLANSMSIASAQQAQQQQIQLQHLSAVSNAAAPGSNLQFQILNVSNSPSRPTLTVPTASLSGAGYSMCNIITGTNASIASKQTLAPRLVQIPHNVRLSGVRSNAPGFTTAPITLPPNLGRQTLLLKTDTGQVHVVNVGQHAPTQSATIRLQAAPSGTTVVPGGIVNSHNQTMKPTQLTGNIGGSSIVLPVSMAPAVVNNNTINNNTIGASTVQAISNNSNNHQSPTPVGVAATATAMATIGGTPGTPIPTPGIGSSSSTQPLSVHTTAANTQAASAAPSQMSPTTAKKKCKNFLSTLIRLANEQPENVASNVKTLIQGLIDDTIQPEDFTNQLQRELNSSPQPCLVPFLRRSLPYLRLSLVREELTIDGVRPPPANTVALPSNMMAQTLSQIQNIGSVQPARPSLTHGVRLLGPSGTQLAPNLITTSGVPGGAQIITSLTPPPNASIAPLVLSSVNSPNQLPQPNLISNVTTMAPTVSLPPHSTRLPSIHPTTSIAAPHHLQPTLITRPAAPHLQSIPSAPLPPAATTPSRSKSKSKSKAKSEKAKKEKESATAATALSSTSTTVSTTSSTSLSATPAATSIGDKSHHGPVGERKSSSFREDDDINDVATMGGVNLVEESQRILAGNAEIIGQQIRSCKDEPFLYASPLQQTINKIAKRFDLEDCSHDVVALVSHATEERLKTLVEQLGVIAEHRQEQLRNNPNYEIVQDVKAQAQFLQELDRIEKRRHEEQEREVLIRAAKSRSKVDDPDHIAIKARAKEMQRLELEEIRQREANETALQAIGNPKKRLKTIANNNVNNSTTGVGNSASINSLGNSLGGLGSTFGSNLNNSINNSGSNNANNSSSFFNTFISKPIKRIKRVTMKDVLFLMESDHQTVRSRILYKAYATR